MNTGGQTAHVSCPCGARLRVSAQTSGRRVRCPKCGEVARVPAAEPAVAPAITVEPGTTENATGETRIKFHCGCGKSLNAPTAAIGKHVKCPACGAIQRVPANASAVEQRLAADDDLLSVADALRRGEAVTDYVRPAATDVPRPAARDLEFGIAPPVEIPRDERLHAPVKAGPPRKCPSCGTEYPGSAKICVACGVDLKTGRALVTTQDENLDQIYIWTENIIRVASFFIWLGIYPIASEAFGLRKPWVIRGVTVATVLISLCFFAVHNWSDDPSPGVVNLMLWTGDRSVRVEELTQLFERENRDLIPDDVPQEKRKEYIAALVDHHLGEFQPHQLLTHAFLHEGFEHLIGNMIFLYVLGTRVNALIGNALTLIIYPLLAVLSAAFQMVSMQHEPMGALLGASGAIMGLAGMYLVLMPTPKVHIAAWFRFMFFIPILIRYFLRLFFGVFECRGFWLVLLFISLDILAISTGWVDGTAHWAHLGGFISGVVIALILLFSRLVNARGGDILNAVLGKHAWALIGKPNRPGRTLW